MTPQYTSSQTYDYIVVGAGSAGCVMASRLSEDAGTTVVLVEAGPPADDFWISTPAGMAKLFLNKRFNWGFTTEDVPTLGGRTVYWPRGMTLGGSSAINGMVYMRGHPLDFDHWADLGNEGWGWDDVLPYFKKSERNERGASELHGGDGLLTVSDAATRHPLTDDFITAASRVGVPHIAELNGPPFEGVSYQQFTIRQGRRDSTYTAFVKPVLHRRNLTVATDTRVTRLAIENGAATGIEVLRNGRPETIAARREVILCAGALGSPQLLMLSGIGNGADLQKFGIPLVRDLPGVGRNLQDHWYATFVMKVNAESSSNQNLHGLRKYIEGMRYLLTRRGLLALGSSAVSAYVRSTPDWPQPDIQLAIRPITLKFREDGGVEVDREPGVSGVASLVGPKSVGHMELVSPDPMRAPAFHPNYLSDPEDIRRTLIGMRLFRQICATEPLAGRIVAEISPGPKVTTDEQLLEHLQKNGNTGWHQCGTCKMGSDEMAVVDRELRVRGVGRLRVVDASIMPRITSGNTNAPTIMIAEKAADMVRRDAAAA